MLCKFLAFISPQTPVYGNLATGSQEQKYITDIKSSFKIQFLPEKSNYISLNESLATFCPSSSNYKIRQVEEGKEALEY